VSAITGTSVRLGRNAQYQRFLRGHNLICSMSAAGSCADNALAEGFFGMLKRERVNRRRYLTPAEARADVFDYIERFHNPRVRRRLAIEERETVGLNSTVRETGA
jgi:putative transposase